MSLKNQTAFKTWGVRGGWKGILGRGNSMLQMYHEVEKYGKFRGKLCLGRQKMWWRRDSEHGGRPRWEGGTAHVQFGQPG